MGNNVFTILSKAKIQEKRNVVISYTDRDNFAIGQQVEIEESGRTTSMFLKGAMFVDKDKLINIRDALNEALSKLEDE